MQRHWGALRHQEVQKTKSLEVTDLKKMLRYQFQNCVPSIGVFEDIFSKVSDIAGHDSY